MQMQYSSEEAERMVQRHRFDCHPEIECQCLECLYAREVLAQCRIWREIS